MAPPYSHPCHGAEAASGPISTSGGLVRVGQCLNPMDGARRHAQPSHYSRRCGHRLCGTPGSRLRQRCALSPLAPCRAAAKNCSDARYCRGKRRLPPRIWPCASQRRRQLYLSGSRDSRGWHPHHRQMMMGAVAYSKTLLSNASSQVPLVEAREYSVARFSKKFVCSTAFNRLSSQGNGFSSTL